MKIIIGLGNPGSQYEGTRHNIGFALADKLQQDFDFPQFCFSKKFNAEISEGSYLPTLPTGRQAGQAGKLPASTRGDIRSSTRGGQTTNYKLILVKPQAFMNLSGVCVRAILDFYKLTPEDIIVVQDDIDLEIGTFKVATDSRSAGHNGVQNIIDLLGTQKFTRLRIGIGATTTEESSCRLGVHDFVLGKFSQEENEKNDPLFADIIEALKKLL